MINTVTLLSLNTSSKRSLPGQPPFFTLTIPLFLVFQILQFIQILYHPAYNSINMKNLFILCLLSLLLASSLSQKRLIFVQELFRHGARYPIYSSSADDTTYAIDLKSQGQLTTQGKKMHYLLGKRIYEKYWNDLFRSTPYQDNYNQSKFFFKSTNVNRTIQSCQSHLMGIFQNTKTLTISEDQANFSNPLWPNTFADSGDVFTNAPDFHPLPIHVEDSYSTPDSPGDFLRAYDSKCCPNQDLWQSQNQQEKFAAEVRSNPNFTATIDELSKIVDKPLSFSQVADYFDNYETTLYLGRKTLPIFDDPKYKRQLEYIYVLDLYINLFYTQKQLKATSSRFFHHTVQNIKRAIDKRDIQWVVYSAHDTTVANMLAAMNFTNVKCMYDAYLNGDSTNKDTCIPKYPGYTASIIFQVWEDDVTMERTFKIRYLGEVRKIPFCDYQEQCPVDRLEEWWKQNMYQPDFLWACGVIDNTKAFYLTTAVLEFGIIIVLALYLLVKWLKTKGNRVDSVIGPKKQNRQTMLTEQVESKE